MTLPILRTELHADAEQQDVAELRHRRRQACAGDQTRCPRTDQNAGRQVPTGVDGRSLWVIQPKFSAADRPPARVEMSEISCIRSLGRRGHPRERGRERRQGRGNGSRRRVFRPTATRAGCLPVTRIDW